MKKILILIISIYLPNLFLTFEGFDVTKLKLSKETDQIMIVVPLNNHTYTANFYFYVKKQDKWFEYLISEAHIGQNGLGKEREGDRKTPVGIYSFNCYFGIADNPGTKLSYIKLNDSLYWDGDSNSTNYNLLVNIETYKDFDTTESEHLIEETLGYQYAMNMNYNEDRVAKKGAGIFLHCYTERPYTAGCVALPENNMIKVLKMANENARILIDYIDNIYNY